MRLIQCLLSINSTFSSVIDLFQHIRLEKRFYQKIYLKGGKTTKQKSGLVLFWIAVIWTILWGVIGSVFVGSAFRNLTMDELNMTRIELG